MYLHNILCGALLKVFYVEFSFILFYMHLFSPCSLGFLFQVGFPIPSSQMVYLRQSSCLLLIPLHRLVFSTSNTTQNHVNHLFIIVMTLYHYTVGPPYTKGLCTFKVFHITNLCILKHFLIGYLLKL